MERHATFWKRGPVIKDISVFYKLINGYSIRYDPNRNSNRFYLTINKGFEQFYVRKERA